MARYGLSADAINGSIEAAVGGAAATQVVQGERTFDLVVRLQPQYRATPEQIGNILLATPDGQQVPLREVADIRGRQRRVVHLPPGQLALHRRPVFGRGARSRERRRRGAARPSTSRSQAADRILASRWGGEFEEYTASRAQMNVVLPITIILIFGILFVLYHNFKFPLITVVGVILSAPLGGLLAMLITDTPFSVSSMIGFLALFGVSVQTAVVYISYANELRLERHLASPRRRGRRRCSDCGRS